MKGEGRAGQVYSDAVARETKKHETDRTEGGSFDAGEARRAKVAGIVQFDVIIAEEVRVICRVGSRPRGYEGKGACAVIGHAHDSLCLRSVSISVPLPCIRGRRHRGSPSLGSHVEHLQRERERERQRDREKGREKGRECRQLCASASVAPYLHPSATCLGLLLRI
jgi:hypothetical protein